MDGSNSRHEPCEKQIVAAGVRKRASCEIVAADVIVSFRRTSVEQPSKVTLVTTSRYVARGLRYGLSSWRESDYHWERFGVPMPIRNADLWQRVDVAMNFHGLNCRLIQPGAGLVNGGEVDEASWAEGLPLADESLSLLPSAAKLSDAARRFSATAHVQHSVLAWLEKWWKLALSWSKGWRNGQHAIPAAYGT